MSITRVQRANAARHLHFRHRLVSVFIFRGVLIGFIIDYHIKLFPGTHKSFKILALAVVSLA